MSRNRGKGEAYAWLRAHIAHEKDDCLWWPFGRRQTGYGSLQHLGVIHYAHRLMCELVHGPAPTPDHEAAHSCGNGMAACVNPRHLSWKTRSENQLDRRRHGTANTNPWGRYGKLTDGDKAEICALKGRMTQRQIAAKFECHFQTVSRLHKAAASSNSRQSGTSSSEGK